MTNTRSGGPAPASGVLRSRAEDFVVEEQLGFEPDGAGEHLLVYLEKIDANTGWVAEQLARFAGLKPRDVGFAGRKDRHAVARQWFSLWLPGGADPDLAACKIEGVRILNSGRHSRKLRPGALAANCFEIVVRDLAGDLSALDERLGYIATAGVPNYFGAQRFGRNGANLTRARDWFAGTVRLQGTRRSMALSAARSAIFNSVLAARIDAGSWTTAIAGDALNLNGRGGFFICAEPDTETQDRLNGCELHVTGPLWGDGDLLVSGDAAELELAVAAAEPDLIAGLQRARLKHERRALRVLPQSLTWDIDGSTLTVAFALPKGTYATTVLAEVLDLTTADPQPAG